MIELVGLGHNCVDYRARVSKVADFDGDNGELLDLRLSYGGPATIAMIAAQRLGAQTSLISSVGDDEYGKMVIDVLKREGVAADLMRVSSATKTQVAVIMVDAQDGRRAINVRAGGVVEYGLTEAEKRRIARAKVLHLDGGLMPLAQEAARWARENGVKVTLDANVPKPGMAELIGLCDYLVTSTVFPRRFFPDFKDYDEAARRLLDMGPSVVAVTFGSEGSRTWTRDGAFHRPAFKVRALDTCGAGDTFHGAYAYGVARGWDLPYITDFASACAAMKIANVDDYLGIPTLAELQAFMAANGVPTPA